MQNHDRYISQVGYCQFIICSDYLGCYRVMIVPGHQSALRLKDSNCFIEGEIVEIDGRIFYKDWEAIRVCDKLNLEAGLDPEQCFMERLPQITKNLQSADKETMWKTSVSCYKFNDDCHYADKRFKEYYKLKKITREYYS